MPAIPFAPYVERLMQDAGLGGTRLVHTQTHEQHFGNSLAVFGWGALLLRFVRDRSQELLDIAIPTAPQRFYRFSDLAIASGWTTIDDVLARREPAPLTQLLARLHAQTDELQAAFSEPRVAATKAALERAESALGHARMAKLRRLAP